MIVETISSTVNFDSYLFKDAGLIDGAKVIIARNNKTPNIPIGFILDGTLEGETQIHADSPMAGYKHIATINLEDCWETNSAGGLSQGKLVGLMDGLQSAFKPLTEFQSKEVPECIVEKDGNSLLIYTLRWDRKADELTNGLSAL